METLRYSLLNFLLTFFVLILPMRNGNFSIYGISSLFNIVRSYPTYEEWKQDWGRKDKVDLSAFLSYLWGMETMQIITIINSFNFCSYPTYEEWKRCLWNIVPERIFYYRSYPTYEEWKPSSISFISCFSSYSSYPTYEEWKLEPSLSSLAADCRFLSYLWGMETNINITKGPVKLEVLILPMRNGNLAHTY